MEDKLQKLLDILFARGYLTTLKEARQNRYCLCTDDSDVDCLYVYGCAVCLGPKLKAFEKVQADVPQMIIDGFTDLGNVYVGKMDRTELTDLVDSKQELSFAVNKISNMSYIKIGEKLFNTATVALLNIVVEVLGKDECREISVYEFISEDKAYYEFLLRDDLVFIAPSVRKLDVLEIKLY